MLKIKNGKSLLAWLLIAMFVSPIVAQRRPAAAPRKPAPPPVQEIGPSFDSLLAADSYKVYCEIRGVGGLIRSSAVNDLLDPLMKLGKPPKEFKTIVKWLNAHADVLGGSRLLVASFPSRPNVPQVLVAVEFSSPEEAKKFYPELRDFIPKLLPTPSPTPAPSPSPSATTGDAPKSEDVGQPEVRIQTVPLNSVMEAEPARLPQMSQAGSLVFISDTAFKLTDLKPRRSKALEEDVNFTIARNRFATESVFVYIDLKAIQKEEREQQQKWEEERKKEETARAAAIESGQLPPGMTESSSDVATAELTEEETNALLAQVPTPEPAAAPVTGDPESTASPQGPPPGSMDFDFLSLLFLGGFGRGATKWPEAMGAAVLFEGDAYVARVLLLNGPDGEGSSIPFMPQFVSGPPIVPAASGIFPADTELFASSSLDYVQIYDRLLPLFLAGAANATSDNANEKLPESPFKAYETKLGLSIRDDLLPLLGSELALALLKKEIKEDPDASNQPVAPNEPGKEPTPTPVSSEPNPVVAIAVKDREAVARLLPRIIETFGFKGAAAFASTEKRGSTEIVSYAGAFAYAFIDNFLVLAADPADTRRVVDSYLNNETLSSNTHYRNFTRWQSRQVLGQVYVAPSLVEQVTLGKPTPGDKLHEFLSRLNPVIDPLTYSLTNDGVGHLHELHVPKNLLQLIVAGATSEIGNEPIKTNESTAQSTLRTLFSAQATFQATQGNGSYGTLEELISTNLVSKESLERSEYRIELSVAGSKFSATAVPLNYGATGRLSYFIDETGVLRAGDHGGGGATLSDPPIR